MVARPETNATGFTQFEFTLSAKWLELLREIAPQVARLGIVRELEGQAGIAQWAVIGAAASPLGVELIPINNGSFFVQLVLGGKSKRVDSAKFVIGRIGHRAFDGSSAAAIGRLPQNTEEGFRLAHLTPLSIPCTSRAAAVTTSRHS